MLILQDVPLSAWSLKLEFAPKIEGILGAYSSSTKDEKVTERILLWRLHNIYIL